jgi:hypothetical protein
VVVVPFAHAVGCDPVDNFNKYKVIALDFSQSIDDPPQLFPNQLPTASEIDIDTQTGQPTFCGLGESSEVFSFKTAGASGNNVLSTFFLLLSFLR